MNYTVCPEPLAKELAETQKLQGQAVSEPPKPLGGQWTAVSLESLAFHGHGDSEIAPPCCLMAKPLIPNSGNCFW